MTALVVGGAVVASSLVAASPAYAASVLLDETFTGATVTDPRAIGLDDACLTAAELNTTPPAGASNLSDCADHSNGGPTAGVTPGWLQLTDIASSRTGGMVFDRALPSTAGLVIEFDQAQYGGSGADGIGFFLSDGSRQLTNTGAPGGSLGYGQRATSGLPGVDGGYLGVGFDAWGNFAWGNEGLGVEGCAVQSPFTDRVANTVTLRGPGDGMSGYCFLASTALPAGGSSLPGSLRVGSPATPDDAARNTRVTVSPGTYPTVTVEIDFTGTGTAYQTVLTYTMTDPSPASYKFGFSASTGGLNDVHLVRNVRISSLADLGDISVIKQVDRTEPQPAYYALGDTIPYQFVVTNTGVEGITGIVVTDPLISDVTCPSTTLGPAGGPDSSMVCTGSYTVTATDAQSTTLTNTATVVAQNSEGEPVSDTATATVDIVIAHAGLALEKVALLVDGNGNDLADPGESIEYSFVVTNTGTVTLTDPVVDDPRAGAVSCAGTIAPGASITCTADAAYVVVEADVLAGGVVNTATVSATPPAGVDAPEPATDTVTVPTPIPDAALSLQKIATLNEDDDDGIAQIGDTISYSFVLSNVGNVALTDVGVSDPAVGEVVCAQTTLEVGESITCTATADHIVTEEDVLAGAVSNTATGEATPPVNVGFVPPVDTAVIPTIAPAAGLDIQKSSTIADADGNGLADIGELVSYSFVVRNTGTVTIYDITVSDPVAGAVTCPATSLAGGESMTCAADEPREVTEDDLLAGGLVNTATADGVPPDGIDPITPPTDTVTTPTPAASAGLAITKIKQLQDANSNGLADLGELIAYSFVVFNTGTVTVSDITVTDPLAGAISCPSTSLAGGARMSCTADSPYVVTEADVLARKVVNTGTANGTPPPGVSAFEPPSDTVTTTVEYPTAGIELIKTALLDDANGNGLGDVGETIDYAFQVSNTGNVTLDPITITDPLIGDVTCELRSVPPAESTRCTGAPYTITATDAARGVVVNTAQAGGVPPTGVVAPWPSQSTASVSTIAAPPPPPTPPGDDLPTTGGSFDGGTLVLGAVLLAIGVSLRIASRIRLGSDAPVT